MNGQHCNTLGKKREIFLEPVDISTSVFLFRETSAEDILLEITTMDPSGCTTVDQEDGHEASANREESESTTVPSDTGNISKGGAQSILCGSSREVSLKKRLHTQLPAWREAPRPCTNERPCTFRFFPKNQWILMEL